LRDAGVVGRAVDVAGLESLTDSAAPRGVIGARDRMPVPLVVVVVVVERGDA
jgi:hypothetical protein